MSESQVQVIVGTFDDANDTGKAPRSLGSMTVVGTLEFVDAAALLRQLDGRIRIEDTSDADQDQSPAGPSLSGELVGLIFPPGTLTPPAGAAAAGVHGDRDLPTPGEDLGDNLVQQMQRLAVLRDRDVLTEAEYQRQRTLLAIAARDRRATTRVHNKSHEGTEPRLGRGDDTDD